MAKGLQPKDKIVGNTSRVGKDNICLVTQDTLVFGKSSLGCNLNLDLIVNPPLIQNLVEREGDAGDQDAQEGAGAGHDVNNYIRINVKDNLISFQFWAQENACRLEEQGSGAAGRVGVEAGRGGGHGGQEQLQGHCGQGILEEIPQVEYIELDNDFAAQDNQACASMTLLSMIKDTEHDQAAEDVAGHVHGGVQGQSGGGDVDGDWTVQPGVGTNSHQQIVSGKSMSMSTNWTGTGGEVHEERVLAGQ